MSDRHDDATDIAPLLRLAGPRESAPPERAMRVRTAVRDEWRRQTRVRSRSTSVAWPLGALAAAALVVVGVRLAVRDTAPVESRSAVIATIETVSGAADVRVGDPVRSGDRLDTGPDARAALRTASGVIVRVDTGTRLTLVSAAALVLDQGAIYVDSGATPASGSIEVRTRFGVARDIGTRFEVRLTGSALRVRVRDGLVQLTQGTTTHSARFGDELTLGDSGRVDRRTIAVYGADWAWTAAQAAPFELEGRTLRAFLDWMSAENGWRLRFANEAAEKKAATVILHGSIRGLPPEEALAAVLPTVGVEHQLADGVLTIRFTPGEGAR